MSSRFPHSPARAALFTLCALAFTLGLLLAPCKGQAAQASAAREQEGVLRLGVTPAMESSGFLEYLARAFERDTGIRVQGHTDTVWNLYALAQGCSIDAFFSNIPEVEFSAMQAGPGKGWVGGFYGHYLVVGPRGNPSGVPSSSILAAMGFIAANKIPWTASRDGSAADQAELYTWRMLRMDDISLEKWYLKANPRPYSLLPTAAARRAYALSDAWSWLLFKQSYTLENCPLEVVVPTSPLMPDQYNLVTLSADQCPEIREEPARRFAEWLVLRRTQEYIAAFRCQGEALFHPLDPEARQ